MKKEPVVIIAAVLAVVNAILLQVEMSDTLHTVLAIASVGLAALVQRQSVYAPATVEKQARARRGAQKPRG